MRISGVETIMVQPPAGTAGGKLWTFVKVLTDSGIVGYGEAQLSANPTAPYKADSLAFMVRDLCDAVLIGENPFHIARLMQRLYEGPCMHYPDVSMLNVMSALDMCLWDILGKDLNRPVHALLGGAVRDRLRAYSYISALPKVHSDGAENLRYWVDRGLTGVKLDPIGKDPLAHGHWEQATPSLLSLPAIAKAARRFGELRDLVGDRCDLMVGTHGQMSPAGAIRLARALEPYRPLWLEEPVPPEGIGELAQVARATCIPIATGERLTNRYEFADLLEQHAAHVIQFDVGRCGGISEAKVIADMADAHYAHIAPHVWGGPVLAAASIQVDLCCRNFLIQESIGDWSGFHADILREPIIWKDGFIIPSERPGLGYELNEGVARKYAPS
jgi:2-dehydro-3-deoxyphosphogalactonate aldolase